MSDLTPHREFDRMRTDEEGGVAVTVTAFDDRGEAFIERVEEALAEVYDDD